jgi:hypothetical protein
MDLSICDNDEQSSIFTYLQSGLRDKVGRLILERQSKTFSPNADCWHFLFSDGVSMSDSVEAPVAQQRRELVSSGHLKSVKYVHNN